MPDNQHRVLHYLCTTYHTSTGSSHTKLYPFTQAHADEVSTILEIDGISLLAAIKLCEQWSRRSQHDSIRYSYRIPFVHTKK